MEVALAQASVVVAEPRFLLAVLVAILAGLVRGFSGFGSALIYVPLVAALYSPRHAGVSILIIDFFCTLPLAGKEFRLCNWREVMPVVIGTAIGLPFGVQVLLMVDPIWLRWAISALIVVFVGLSAVGWKYRGRTNPGIAGGTGLLSGIMTGAAQMGGPIVVMYWLGTGTDFRQMRANLMVLFILANLIGLLIFFYRGLLSVEVALFSVMVGLPFFLAIYVGGLLFKGASSTSYVRFVNTAIAFAALISLPIFEAWLR